MHNIEFIRSNPQEFDKQMLRRGCEAKLSNHILALDQKIRNHKTELQELLTQKNNIAKEIGGAKSRGEDIAPILAKGEAMKARIKEFEENKAEAELHDLLSALPNVLSIDVPAGDSEEDNAELRKVGEIKQYDFAPQEHDAILENLGFVDFETAAKVSGARFVYLKGVFARLERVLADLMLNMLTSEYGFLEMTTPLLVRTESLYGTGQLPKFAEDCFKTTDDRWLIPTSEVSLANYFRESRLEEKELPHRLCSYTPCFRSEAGSAGADTKGMIRLHQFAKVEMVVITDKDSSAAEHERILGIAERILQLLEIPYRVVSLCSSDTGFSANKTYDIEVWLPGQNCYREISSSSNCLDFQSIRMKTRYKNAEGKYEYAHTLNGTGLAIGRAMVAITENYQNADGSITIPEILKSYFPGKDIF
ncbi:MAG: serine--tRNA ligase [Rickettsiales bacterium]|jgi:seryl-tRNA synthetase|nr:serine--tRNA ligase [Rickettsiales bacterium]